MAPRLTTALQVSALMRRAEAAGGFGTVLAKGDPTAGAMLLVLLERGQPFRIYERVLGPGGEYKWQNSTPAPLDSAEVPRFIAKHRQFDADIWAVELDVPSAERFAAEMMGAN